MKSKIFDIFKQIIKTILYIANPFFWSYVLYLVIPIIKELPELKYEDVFYFCFVYWIIITCLKVLWLPKRVYTSCEYPTSTGSSYIIPGDRIKISAVHEAGHAVVAYCLGFSIDCVSIQITEESGGRTVIPGFTGLAQGENIKKEIIILYAGYQAELSILDNPSTGCIGNESSDIERANQLLKQYIMLTDSSLSLTGTEMTIESKMEELSKELLKETEKLVIDHKDKICELAKLLEEKQEIGKVEFYSFITEGEKNE